MTYPANNAVRCTLVRMIQAKPGGEPATLRRTGPGQYAFTAHGKELAGIIAKGHTEQGA